MWYEDINFIQDCCGSWHGYRPITTSSEILSEIFGYIRFLYLSIFGVKMETSLIIWIDKPWVYDCALH